MVEKKKFVDEDEFNKMFSLNAAVAQRERGGKAPAKPKYEEGRKSAGGAYPADETDSKDKARPYPTGDGQQDGSHAGDSDYKGPAPSPQGQQAAGGAAPADPREKMKKDFDMVGKKGKEDLQAIQHPAARRSSDDQMYDSEVEMINGSMEDRRVRERVYEKRGPDFLDYLERHGKLPKSKSASSLAEELERKMDGVKEQEEQLRQSEEELNKEKEVLEETKYETEMLNDQAADKAQKAAAKEAEYDARLKEVTTGLENLKKDRAELENDKTRVEDDKASADATYRGIEERTAKIVTERQQLKELHATIKAEQADLEQGRVKLTEGEKDYDSKMKDLKANEARTKENVEVLNRKIEESNIAAAEAKEEKETAKAALKAIDEQMNDVLGMGRDMAYAYRMKLGSLSEEWKIALVHYAGMKGILDVPRDSAIVVAAAQAVDVTSSGAVKISAKQVAATKEEDIVAAIENASIDNRIIALINLAEGGQTVYDMLSAEEKALVDDYAVKTKSEDFMFYVLEGRSIYKAYEHVLVERGNKVVGRAKEEAKKAFDEATAAERATMVKIAEQLDAKEKELKAKQDKVEADEKKVSEEIEASAKDCLIFMKNLDERDDRVQAAEQEVSYKGRELKEKGEKLAQTEDMISVRYDQVIKSSEDLAKQQKDNMEKLYALQRETDRAKMDVDAKGDALKEESQDLQDREIKLEQNEERLKVELAELQKQAAELQKRTDEQKEIERKFEAARKKVGDAVLKKKKTVDADAEIMNKTRARLDAKEKELAERGQALGAEKGELGKYEAGLKAREEEISAYKSTLDSEKAALEEEKRKVAEERTRAARIAKKATEMLEKPKGGK